MITLPPDHRFDRVGECIYCGRRDDLTLEHIIPFGLVGRLKLPEASCRPCAKLTSAFEREIQVNYLGGFRSRVGVPLRKGRKRNYPLTFWKPDGDDLTGVPIPPEDYPRVLVMPLLPLPGFLQSDEENAALRGKLPDPWVYQDERDIERLQTKYGFFIVKVDLDTQAFQRMVAKIAHSFAVGVFGLSGLQSYKQRLPEIIRNDGTRAWQLVGGSLTSQAEDNAFELALFSQIIGPFEILMATMQFFSWLGAPSYQAIIGLKRAKTGTPTFVRHALAAQPRPAETDRPSPP